MSHPILIPDEYRDKSLEEPLLEEWGFKLVEGESEKPLLKKGEQNAD